MIVATLVGCGDGLIFFTGRWNIIHATRMPGMTFAQAFAG
jgi:hypothetical protein